ncbi:hypothetical protein ACEQPO_23105 [Bacillus sp. SL00103]
MTLNMKIESMQKFHTFEIPTVIKHGIACETCWGRSKSIRCFKIVVTRRYLPGGRVKSSHCFIKEAQIDVVLFDKVLGSQTRQSV